MHHSPNANQMSFKKGVNYARRRAALTGEILSRTRNQKTNSFHRSESCISDSKNSAGTELGTRHHSKLFFRLRGHAGEQHGNMIAGMLATDAGHDNAMAGEPSAVRR